MSPSFLDRVVALATGFGGVDRCSGKIREQVISQWFVVRSSTTDSMHADNNLIGGGLGHPGGIRKAISIEGMKMLVFEADLGGHKGG